MERKLKTVFIFIGLFIILPLFAGCDPWNSNVNFLGYTKDGVSLSTNGHGDYVVTSGYNDMASNIKISDPEVVSYKATLMRVGKNSSGSETVRILSSCYQPKTATPYEELGTLEKGYRYFVEYKFYTEASCKGDVSYIHTDYLYTYQPEYKDDENIASPTQDLVNLVGGLDGYCNVDANGTKKVADTDNLFVKIAYSQIGYKEKSSNGNLNSCTSNSGSGNYQKYGGNGSAWCSSFVNWALKKAGVTPPFSASSSEMRTWASNNGRLVTSASNCKNGDLALYDGHVAIVYIPDGSTTKYTINGNWNDKVVLVQSNSLTLNGHTFKGCASMSGYTY